MALAFSNAGTTSYAETMPATPAESTFELATIERLKQLGYRYLYGGEIDRPLAAVLEAPLRGQLSRRYRHLPSAAIEQAIRSSRRRRAPRWTAE